MHFQGTDGSNNHSCLGFQPAVSAFDIEEFFHTNISSKSSFGDTESIWTDELESNLICHN